MRARLTVSSPNMAARRTEVVLLSHLWKSLVRSFSAFVPARSRFPVPRPSSLSKVDVACTFNKSFELCLTANLRSTARAITYPVSLLYYLLPTVHHHQSRVSLEPFHSPFFLFTSCAVLAARGPDVVTLAVSPSA